jgi:hypothetical protein
VTADLGIERQRAEIEADARHGGGPRFHNIMRRAGSPTTGNNLE